MLLHFVFEKLEDDFYTDRLHSKSKLKRITIRHIMLIMAFQTTYVAFYAKFLHCNHDKYQEVICCCWIRY